MSDVNIKINIQTNQATAAISKLRTQLRAFDSQAKKSSKSAGNFGSGLGRVADIAKGIISANLFFAIGQQVKRAFVSAVTQTINFEKALVGVGKTTNIAGAELAEFGREAEKLARKIPVASTELLRLAQTAGQLGVRGSKNLLKFAETAARLASATNVSAEDAVTGLTRIIRLTKDSDENIDRLGASLVELGNNFNASESKILSAALSLSQTTSGFKIASTEVLGFATAIAETGSGSEKAATAIGGVLTDLAKSFALGGDAAKNFAEATGLSLTEVSKIINEDAGKALDLFLGSLSDVSDNTIELTKRLNNLGVSEKRETQVIQALVKLRDTQVQAVDRSSAAYRENTALTDESQKSFDTLGSDLLKAAEASAQLAKALLEGSGLASALKFTADQLSLIAGFWAEYINSTGKAEESTRDLTTRLKALGDEGFTDLDLTSLTDVTAAADALVVQFKEVDREIRSVQEGTTTYAGGVARATEKLTAQSSALKELASDLRTVANSLTPEEGGSADSALTAKQEQNAALLQEELNLQLALTEIGLLKEGVDKETRERELTELAKFGQAKIDLQRTADAMEIVDTTKQGIALTRIETEQAKRKLKEEQKLEKLRLDGKRTTNAAFAGLATAENQTLAAIGKAGAIAQIAIDTPKAVSSSYAFGTGIGGPALGAIFGAVAAAHQAQQAASVAGLRFQDGGIVPGASTTGDNVTARVNSGEMILNRQQQSNLFEIAQRGGTGSTQEVPLNNVVSVEIDGEAIAKSVSRSVANGANLGEFGV